MSARKSPRRSLGEHNMNAFDPLSNITLPITNKEFLSGAARKTGFALGKVNDDMSPNQQARRNARPRKSILKSLSTMNEENTTDFTTLNYADTVAFGDLNYSSRQSLARRVSFARNAHVRMFDSKSEDDRRPPVLKSAMRKSISAPVVTSSASLKSRSSLPSSISDKAISVSRKVVEIEQVTSKPVAKDHETPERARAAVMISAGEHVGPKTQQPDGGVQGIPSYSPHQSMTLSNPNDDTDEEEQDDGSDMDMDMDETVAYGGILRRESNVTVIEADITADMSEDMSIVTASSVDEEKTMDFTIAIGGLLPRSPPKHAARNRSSIGYSLPESPNSVVNRIRPGQTLEGDPSEEEDGMEETQAFGGIMGDDTVSSISEQSIDEREKTMTFSFGDISAVARQAAEQALAEEQQIQQQQQNDEDADDDEEGGMSMTMALGGIVSNQSSGSGLAQSAEDAPSFARPTLSSSQRSREPTPKKRNVFAPSPSPNKQSSTPRTGMAVAGEVAKRLSFGSVTSSAGKKRPSAAMEDLNENSSAKKAKLSSSTNVFAPAPAVTKANIFEQGLSKSTSAPSTAASSASVNLSASVPAKRIPSPVKLAKRLSVASSPGRSRASLAAPVPWMSIAQPPKSPRRSMNAARSTTPQRLPPKSPGKSPALRRMLGEDVHREEIEAAEQLHDGMDAPTISLARFLELVGVEFMENLPKVQRKSLANGLGHSYPMSSDRSFELAEYAEAEVQHVFLSMYNWAAETMKNDIATAQAYVVEQEHICSLDNPPVIREYLTASEEDRGIFEVLLKTYKTNTVLKAKEAWYEWKRGFLEMVRPDVEAILVGMQMDAERLESMEEQADELLPELQARLEALEAEVHRERVVVGEIAECDQNELADFKAAIAEQTIQINGFTTDLNDSNAKLEVLQQKLDELDKKKRACETRIAVAKSKCDQYTRSDILRFKAEYESLQTLHLWRIGSITPSEISLVYDNEVRFSVGCKNHVPVLSTAQLAYVGMDGTAGKSADRASLKHPKEVSDGLFKLVEEEFRGMRKVATSLSSLIQQTSSLLSSAQRLRSELSFLTMRLPTKYRTVQTAMGPAFVCTAVLLLKGKKAKVELNFCMTGAVLKYWAEGMGGVEVAARVVYGKADSTSMEIAARDILSSQGYVGALQQACEAAMDVHR